MADPWEEFSTTEPWEEFPAPKEPEHPASWFSRMLKEAAPGMAEQIKPIGLERDPQQVLDLPNKALEPITEPMGRITSEVLQRTGIDPSAQPGKPLVEIPSIEERMGKDFESLSRVKKAAVSLHDAAAAAASGLTTPENIGLAAAPVLARTLSPTVSETTPKVPKEELPETPTATGLRPAIRLMGGDVKVGDAGKVHEDIIKENDLKASDIDQRGFVDESGTFKDRETAAQQVSPTTEEGRAHSTDLPEAKEEPPPEVPDFAAKYDRETLLSRPAWVEPGGAFDKALGSTRESKDPFKGVDITGIWKSLTPEQKQELFARGWNVNPSRVHNQAILTVKQDAVAAQKYYAMQSKRSLLSEPEAGPGTIGEAEMGAAGIGEIPDTGAGGEKYGTAQRLREERAQAGQVDLVYPGAGTSALKTVIEGRQLNESDPELANKLLTEFENDPKKSISTQAMSVTRAKGEQLAVEARKIEEQFGTDSDEFRAAQSKLSEWDKRTKPMQTEWHKQGQAQQGYTDLDTGSFSGIAREYTRQTDKPFPEEHRAQAQETAGTVRKIESEVASSENQVSDIIRNHTSPTNAEKAALDAAMKVVRENAVRIADLESKDRVATTVREHEANEIQRKAAEKAMAAAQEQARQAAIRLARAERTKVSKPELKVWEQIRKYVDNKIDFTSFDDLRNKVAADLGITPNKVMSMLARSDRRFKRVADELAVRKNLERNIKQAAKQWIDALDDPKLEKALRKVPQLFFKARIFGHGGVALGTHAPMVLFSPKDWSVYFPSYTKMLHMTFDPAFFERQVQDLVRDKHYGVALNAGLGINPFQFEDFTDPRALGKLNKLIQAGNRGYFVLKTLRMDMFNKAWEKLPESTRTADMAQWISREINSITGWNKSGLGPKSHIALFAPRLLMSRVSFLGRDPVRAGIIFTKWDKATPGEKRFATQQVLQKATIAGVMYSMLKANQAFLDQTGSKEKINFTDPMRSDWMKFKVAGHDVSYGNPMLTAIRLPMKMFLETGKPEKHRGQFVYPDENIGKTVWQFARSQSSPFMSAVLDLATREDAVGRQMPHSNFPQPKRLTAQGIKPYTWTEWTINEALPIPAQEMMREMWRTGFGMNDEQINQLMSAIAVSGIMAFTGSRITEDLPERKNVITYPK